LSILKRASAFGGRVRKSASLSRTTFTTAADDVSVTSVVSRMIRFAIFVIVTLFIIAPVQAAE